jgi:hypothetical protein
LNQFIVEVSRLTGACTRWLTEELNVLAPDSRSRIRLPLTKALQ